MSINNALRFKLLTIIKKNILKQLYNINITINAFNTIFYIMF